MAESFASGGGAVAIEHFPAGGATAARGSAVLLLHGLDGLVFGGERYRDGARALAAAGHHVFLPHYFNRTGRQMALLADLQRAFLLWLETIGDAVGWLGRRPDIDPERIGVVGISLGAALGLAAAADPRIRALVSVCAPLPDAIAARIQRLPPVLVLHGAGDAVVPVANAHRIAELARGLGACCELTIYSDQGHIFFGAARRDAERRMTAFLDRILHSGAGAPSGPDAPPPVP